LSFSFNKFYIELQQGFYSNFSNFSNFSIDDLNFSLSFRAYVDKSRSAFNRARLELFEFAPS
jgi:hypothetical protein